MNKILIGVLVAFVAVAMADITENPGNQPQDNPWFYAPSSEIPMDQLYGSTPVPSVLTGIDWAAISPAGPEESGFDIMKNGTQYPDFGNDVLVMEHGMPTSGYLATDQDELTGDMYISLLVPKATVDDTVYTYKSTDGGDTWSQFALQVGAAGTEGIRGQQIVVGNDGSGGVVFNFIHYESSGGSGGIWVARRRADGTFLGWTQIVVAGDTINSFFVARNTEDPEDYYLVMHNPTTDIRALSSSDYCVTWGNNTWISGSGGAYPSCAAGGDGYLYVTYPYNDTVGIRVGRNTAGLGGSWNFEDINTEDEGDFTPSVAAARTTPGSSQVAWVLYRHNHAPNYDIHVAQTEDGGASWSGGAAWPPTNSSHTTWEMKYPYIRVSYNSSLLRAVATVPEAGDDSLVYAFSRNTSPTTWEDRGVHNDYGITGEYGGKVEYSADCSGGYITYREYGAEQVWVDAYNFTGVEETESNAIRSLTFAPNPTTTVSHLSYLLASDQHITITLYDATGSLVRNIVDEMQNAGVHTATVNTQNLAAGIYFVRVETETGTSSTSVTVVK